MTSVKNKLINLAEYQTFFIHFHKIDLTLNQKYN